jgi:hypothetical protein
MPFFEWSFSLKPSSPPTTARGRFRRYFTRTAHPDLADLSADMPTA